MIKTYAAFVQNTIDPMLDKLGAVLTLCADKGIPIDRHSLSAFMEKLFLAHICSLMLKGIFGIAITSII